MSSISNHIIESNKAILNMESTAELLGISTATVRNWVRSGCLSAYNKGNQQFFYKSDIENIKLQLIKGNLNKLNKRANKIKASRTFTPNEYIKNLKLS